MHSLTYLVPTSFIEAWNRAALGRPEQASLAPKGHVFPVSFSTPWSWAGHCHATFSQCSLLGALAWLPTVGVHTSWLPDVSLSPFATCRGALGAAFNRDWVELVNVRLAHPSDGDLWARRFPCAPGLSWQKWAALAPGRSRLEQPSLWPACSCLPPPHLPLSITVLCCQFPSLAFEFSSQSLLLGKPKPRWPPSGECRLSKSQILKPNVDWFQSLWTFHSATGYKSEGFGNIIDLCLLGC